MMNITVDDRRRPLTGIEKLQILQNVKNETDIQKKADETIKKQNKDK